jgi:S-DNA-T family DNA segregation ATPase FtsK/SpoIIIE
VVILSDDNFQELFASLRDMWRRRDDVYIPTLKGKKLIISSNKIPAAVEDVINILWKSKDLKPLIHKREFNKQKNKWIFIIHLPAGITYRDFFNSQEYFKDATKRPILIQNKGGVVVLEILNEPLKKGIDYKFTFNPNDYPKMHLPIVLGYSVSGLVVKDLGEFLYLLIGGIPKGGKSTAIHVMLTSLLLNHNNCFPVVIDKKKAEYAPYMNEKRGLLVTEDDDIFNVLQMLNDEANRRNSFLATKRKVKIHNLPLDERPPFIVVIVDELTEIQHKLSQELINRIARVGRSAGFCLILATQRPSAKAFRDGTFTETRALCDARLCFRVKSSKDSEMVLNNSNGLYLPAIPGRGIFQWDQELEIQVPFLNPETDIEEILKNGGVCSNEQHNIFYKQYQESSSKMLPSRQSYFS